MQDDDARARGERLERERNERLERERNVSMVNVGCNCGGKFRTAEDYRDHLPCPPALELRFIKVYRAYMTDGYKNWPSGIYRSKDRAKMASDYGNDPYVVDAVTDQHDHIWLINGDVTKYTEDIEAAKQSGLAKLTPLEREALGVKP